MVGGDIPLSNAIAYLANLDIDCLLVVEAGRLQGWLTAKDVVKLAAQGRAGDNCALRMVMTQPPYILNPEEARDIFLVLHYLQKYRVSQLPVVAKNGEIFGLVTTQGIIPLCSQQLNHIERLEIQIDQFVDAQTNQDYLLQEITDSVSGLIYIYDLEEQRNIYCNRSIFELLGYTPLEIQNMGQDMLVKLVHPEDFPSMLALAEIQRNTIPGDDTLWGMEYRMQHADGSWRWLSSCDRPFRKHPDGRTKQTISVAQDITDRKQMELALQASQHLLSSMIRAIPGIVYLHDLQSQHNIYMNDAGLEFFGYTREQIDELGSNFIREIIHPEDLVSTRSVSIKDLAKEEVQRTEYRLKNAQGEWRWHLKQTMIFKSSPEGVPQQILGVTIDIHDRKQIELELQDNQHLLSSMIQAIPGIVYLHDLQTQHNIYINDAGLEFFGYTREQIDELGSNFIREIIHPEDLVYMTLLTIQNLAKGEVHKSEYRLKSAQGEWRWHLRQTIVFKSSSEGVPQQILGVIIDIHDRKRIEAELQSSQHFLQTVAETIPGILYIYDLQADRNIYVNSLAPEILGYTKAQIDELGDNFLGQIIHPEDLIIIYPLIMEQLATGAIARTEYRLKNAQGEWFWVLEHTTIFQSSAAGIPQQILGIVIDIHDRKLAEAALQTANIELENRVAERTQELWRTNLHLAHEMNEKIKLTDTLRQKEEFFRAVFEQAAVGINIATADGKLAKVNQKMCQMFGYTEAELLTMTWMDLTPPEFLIRGLEFTAKRHRGEIGNQQLEKQMICKDGSRLWIGMTISLYKDPTTGMTYDLAITQDISDRKQAELALRNSEARFQRMVANIPGMVYQFRCDPQGNYSCTYANHYTEEVYEIAATELVRDINQVMDLTHPEELERLNNAILSSFHSLQPWHWVGRIITPSGKLKWVEGNARPEKQANGDVIWDGILRDVTDRKAIEDQIQANLKEKELLLKEIHHRVKNNLQVISSLLTLQCHNITDPAIAALFEDSQTRIYAIALIHEQLYKTTQFDQINFGEYTHNLAFYLQQLYSSPQKSIQIQTNSEEMLLNVETAIPCGLIITELVINALKYAFPQNGNEQLITIELQRLSDQQLSLSVKDNGIGILSDYDLAEINTLGLSLVKMLTQQLEGEITLTCNSGTQFVIIFYELKYSRRLDVQENT